MGSSSTSSLHKSYEYDVFLSFRGEDTRKNFVDHLYYALEQQGIHTYKDDERIKKGKRISDELITSIEDSRSFIIVFSKNYASSAWCLDELVKMMECQKTTEQTAYPVFYDVEPSEVRKQTGEVGKAFTKHKKKKTARKWIEALKEAADLAGWELKNTADGHEAKVINIIAEQISSELCSINTSDDENLIGMESRMQDLESSLEIGVNDVRMIGIKGIGGGGKTTLAKTIFYKLSKQFEGKSFVQNIREASNVPGLRSLQKQILSDVLKKEAINVSSVHEGKNMMRMRLCGKKVLIVLDDVDHLDQLEALAGNSDWFKAGSRIIITTRDEQVLKAHNIKWIHDVNLLIDAEAICLFSRYAFRTSIPIEGYENLSHKVVHYAAGLPLTIKVLGSFLCHKDNLEWEDALERLETIPEQETLTKLEISYISLENDYKEIFLDVACLLKGWKKDAAIRMLESCGFHARNGLRVLEQRSLITVGSNNRLSMHDLIEEMGKNIVRRLHPDEPRRHSRLWIREEIEDVLGNRLGTEDTRCVNLDISDEIILDGLENMNKLRCLILDFEYYSCYFCGYVVRYYFPNTLHYLHLDYYPHCSLPELFRGNNLVTLEMPNSEIIQLWEGGERKVLNKLRFLNLRYSKLRTLDLGLTPNLERLDLEHCSCLVEVHAPIGCLRRLVYLNLSLCRGLKTLSFIKQLESLQTLDLHESGLSGFPDILPRHSNSSLRHLYLNGNDIDELLVDLSRLECLETLDLSNTHIKHLPDSFCMLKHVKSLNLDNCGYLRKLPNDLGQLESLTTLCLVSREIRDVPASICKLKHLKKLAFSACFGLKKLPDDLGDLESLKTLSLSWMNIKNLPVSICMLKHLETLLVEFCKVLKKLPDDLGQLESLKTLSLRGCLIRDVPASICKLKNLKELNLSRCCDLGKLPKKIGDLDCLEKLNLEDTYISHLPQSISLLKGLRIIPEQALDDARISKEYPWPLEKELTELSQCRSLRLPDTTSSAMRITCLTYTNSGDAILALSANAVHKLWKWPRNDQNYTRKATTNVVPQLWQPTSGNLMTNIISNINPEEAVSCFALSKNDSYVISASGGEISLFNLWASEVMERYMLPPPAATFLAFHPQDNNIIAIGMEDSSIRIYNARLKEDITQLNGHNKRITGLAFSNKLNVLVSSGADSQLCVWSTQGWEKQTSKTCKSHLDVLLPV